MFTHRIKQLADLPENASIGALEKRAQRLFRQITQQEVRVEAKAMVNGTVLSVQGVDEKGMAIIADYLGQATYYEGNRHPYRLHGFTINFGKYETAIGAVNDLKDAMFPSPLLDLHPTAVEERRLRLIRRFPTASADGIPR